MKKYDVCEAVITQKESLGEGFYSIYVASEMLAKSAEPGQFAHILVPGRTLRRPISICEIDREKGLLRFVFQIRGAGTAELALLDAGDKLDILAPLGKGFPPAGTGKQVLLIGGGIGVPPLLALAKLYGENAVAALGFRNQESVILEQDFKTSGANTKVATDDGSYGYHGLVTDMIKDETFDVIYTCGPLPMLKAAAGLAKEKDALCYVSLEERMACGVGACLGCAVKLLDETGSEYYGHVCKDGPVFLAAKVCELNETGM